MALAILAPVIIFSATSLNTLLEAERESALRGARETVRASALKADRDLSMAKATLQALSTSTHLLREQWAEFHNQATRATAGSKSWIIVYDENGQQQINSAAAHGAPLPPPVRKQQVQEVLRLNKPTVSNLILGSFTGKYVVLLDYPVTLLNGKQFVISQSFLVQHFSDLLFSPEITPSTLMGIFDRNGSTIARNHRIDEYIGKQPRPDLLKAMMEQEEGWIQNVSREGNKIYTIFTRSALSEWTFTLGVPVREIEAAARNAVSNMALGALVLLFCTLISVYFIVRRLTRSISYAAQCASNLGRGTVLEPVKSGINEVDSLHTAIRHAGELLEVADAEREKLLANEKIARSEAEAQNKAKNQFLAMLGHELRNPLAPITAAAELLQLIEPDAKQLKQTSEIIGRQAQHLTNLVDDLLDVSRVSRGQILLSKDKLDLKVAIELAREQMQPTFAERRHHVDIHVPDEAIVVFGDQKRLVQIFSNLLSNAARYTAEGGHIVFSVEAQENQIVIEVADNGIGMTPELTSRVFDLFSQGERSSDRSQGGLGLGLALVKSLVELHGGSVAAHSKGEDQGSRFIVTLPRISNAALPMAPKSDLDRHATARRLRILIVDDNIDAADTLAMVLKASGHEVLVEYESKRALERAKIELPDISLLDIGMPGMDGYELAHQLRAHPLTSNATLVALTGYGQHSNHRKAIDAGFDYHLIKPLEITKLVAILAQV